jgi:hypothetical protein
MDETRDKILAACSYPEGKPKPDVRFRRVDGGHVIEMRLRNNKGKRQRSVTSQVVPSRDLEAVADAYIEAWQRLYA